MTNATKESIQKPETVRIQFDFANDIVIRIDTLKSKLNVKTRADVMKRLIPCGEVVVDAKERGAKIFVQEPDGAIKQIEFLW